MASTADQKRSEQIIKDAGRRSKQRAKDAREDLIRRGLIVPQEEGPREIPGLDDDGDPFDHPVS